MAPLCRPLGDAFVFLTPLCCRVLAVCVCPSRPAAARLSECAAEDGPTVNRETNPWTSSGGAGASLRGSKIHIEMKRKHCKIQSEAVTSCGTSGGVTEVFLDLKSCRLGKIGKRSVSLFRIFSHEHVDDSENSEWAIINYSLSKDLFYFKHIFDFQISSISS